jgi:hypothetical protein
MQIRAEAIRSVAGTQKYTMDIQSTIDITRENNSRWKTPDYVWQEGDRVRLIGTIDGGTSYYGGLPIGADFIYDYE